MPTLFLSYSSADKRFSDRLARNLRDSGVDIWLDRWEIQVGDSIVEKINQGITANDFIAIVLSPTSVESPWVERELNSSLRRQLAEKNVKILPVLYKTCPIPDIIADIKYADFRRSYQKGLGELLNAIFPDRHRSTQSLSLQEQLEKLIIEVGKDPWDQGASEIDPIVRELKRILGLQPEPMVEALTKLVRYEYGNITYYKIYETAPSIFATIACHYPHLKPQISKKLLEMLLYRLFLPWSEILHSEKSAILSAMTEACGTEAIPIVERELSERGTDDSFYTEELVLVLRKFGPSAKVCVPQLIRIYMSFGGETSPSVREAIAKTLCDIATDEETIKFLKQAIEVEEKLMAEKPKQKKWTEEFDIDVDYALRKAIESIETRRMFEGNST